MNITTNGETRQRAPTAADLAASPNGEVLPEVAETNADRPKRPEDLAPLFSGGQPRTFALVGALSNKASWMTQETPFATETSSWRKSSRAWRRHSRINGPRSRASKVPPRDLE